MNWRELPVGMNMVLAVAVAALVVAAGLYIPGSPLLTQQKTITDLTSEKDQLTAEVQMLAVYKRKHAELQASIAAQQKQLDALKEIVPEEKEVDEFIRMLHSSAASSSVEIRRLTAKAVVPKDFYNEMPFELEFDGPYYAVMGFFGRMGRLARIVNVGNLSFMSVERTRETKGRTKYQVRPGATVVAICTATTFFTKMEEAPPPLPGKGGRAPVKQPAKR